jgi:hypothetical protein
MWQAMLKRSQPNCAAATPDREDQVEVLACFHASRDPRRWN